MNDPITAIIAPSDAGNGNADALPTCLPYALPSSDNACKLFANVAKSGRGLA